MLIGAHVSAAGGSNKAIVRAEEIGAECMQIFASSPRMWSAKPIVDAVAEKYAAEMKRSGMGPTVLHGKYLVALGSAGDVLTVFTTSGNSENVLLALQAAKDAGISTIAFLGRDGGRCKDLAHVEFVVLSDVTARIQEAHELLYHSLCELLDPLLAEHG